MLRNKSVWNTKEEFWIKVNICEQRKCNMLVTAIARKNMLAEKAYILWRN